MTAPPPPAWGTPPPPPPAWATPPGWGAPPALPPRRRHPRRWIWVLVAVMILNVALGGTGAALFVQKIKPPLDAANDYLHDIATGDYTAAFERLCSAAQTDTSPSDLEEYVVRFIRSPFTSFDINFVDVNVHDDRATAKVELSPGFRDLRSVHLRLVKEGGRWRPCGGRFGFRVSDVA